MTRHGECKQCGQCCAILAFPLSAADLEAPIVQEFYRARGLPIVDGMVCVPHVCPHLVAGEDGKFTCDIHDHKPDGCWAFPFTPTCLPAGCGFTFTDDLEEV